MEDQTTKITHIVNDRTIKMEWRNTDDAIIEMYSSIVAKDIVCLDADKPEDVIVHHVFVSEYSPTEPYVLVWGEEDNDYYQCEYIAESEWS